jgi:DNA repair protein RadC
METNMLSTKELLSKLVGIKAARKLYKGRLRPLMLGEDGMEPHPLLAIAWELSKRMLQEEVRQGCTLNTPHVLTDYLTARFLDQKHKSFVAVFLDSEHRVIQVEELFRGAVEHVRIYPREIVKAAIRYNAFGCIFAHNHPVGSPEPSATDKDLTEVLKTALSFVGVETHDHIVVAGLETVSFKERGLL